MKATVLTAIHSPNATLIERPRPEAPVSVALDDCHSRDLSFPDNAKEA